MIPTVTARAAYARRLIMSVACCLLLLAEGATGNAALAGGPTPARYGMSLEAGNTYDPDTDISFAMVTGFALYDYGAFWHQDRPRELQFKIEGAAGSTFQPQLRTVVSLGMAALYYLDFIADGRYRPYAEAGIGLIYTDFRVERQGLRVNFNPQLGLGVELERADGHNLFAAVRLHHLSNAGLDNENRGVNSLILQVGRFF